MVSLLWGQNCCFAHGKDELKKKTYLNSNYKSKICKHYHKNGVCPYGYRCQYFHIRDNESHSHLLTAFCEKIDIRTKEMPDISAFDALELTTKLVPRLKIFKEYAQDDPKAEKTILQQFRDNDF